jgi:hypothetical protein
MITLCNLFVENQTEFFFVKLNIQRTDVYETGPLLADVSITYNILI